MTILCAVGYAAGPIAAGALGAVVSPMGAAFGQPRALVVPVGSAVLPAREWRLIAGKHWQIASSNVEDTGTTDRVEGNRGTCPGGMVEAKGSMKLDPPPDSPRAQASGYSLEEMQKAACTRWISREYPERCAEFDREKWISMSRDLPTKPMHFCIDRFEYPNLKGQYPIILVSFHEAGQLCASAGKRLCTETEWTYACEGDEAQPYPNGYTRDTDACLNDQAWRPVDEHAFAPRDGARAMQELDRLWQGHASGARPKCKSPSGAYDMTGNVDEWTRSSREGERPSILKGGYWGPVRTRCRPSTRSHEETFTFYQQSFRCCADAR